MLPRLLIIKPGEKCLPRRDREAGKRLRTALNVARELVSSPPTELLHVCLQCGVTDA